jgi:hypothetical protein
LVIIWLKRWLPRSPIDPPLDPAPVGAGVGVGLGLADGDGVGVGVGEGDPDGEGEGLGDGEVELAGIGVGVGVGVGVEHGWSELQTCAAARTACNSIIRSEIAAVSAADEIILLLLLAMVSARTTCRWGRCHRRQAVPRASHPHIA